MLLTFATKNYAHWLDLLLRSYRKTNPGRRAKIYLIMDKEDFDQYQSDDLFEFHWIPAYESLDMTVKKGKIKAALRLKTSIILWELIDNHGEKFIWCDADCIVLNDIEPLLNKLDEYNFLATMRPWKPIDQQKLSAGVMGIRSNRLMVEFFAKASRHVWGHWEGWYSDQLNIYKNMPDKMKFYSLTEQEHSLKNTKHTIIMSHHANGYEDLKRYCEEIGAL